MAKSLMRPVASPARLDGLPPIEVAGQLRHLDGLVFIDTAGNSSHRPGGSDRGGIDEEERDRRVEIAEPNQGALAHRHRLMRTKDRALTLGLDERAVARAQILEGVGLASAHESAMLARDPRVGDDHVIAQDPTDGDDRSGDVEGARRLLKAAVYAELDRHSEAITDAQRQRQEERERGATFFLD